MEQYRDNWIKYLRYKSQVSEDKLVSSRSDLAGLHATIEGRLDPALFKHFTGTKAGNGVTKVFISVKDMTNREIVGGWEFIGN